MLSSYFGLGQKEFELTEDDEGESGSADIASIQHSKKTKNDTGCGAFALLMASGGKPQQAAGYSIDVASLLEVMQPMLASRKLKKPSTTVLNNYSEPSKMKYCLRFVEHVWTKEDETQLRDPSISQENLLHVCKDLQARVISKRQELEGGKGRFKPFYMGMGVWAKKWLDDHGNKFDP